MKLKLKKKSIKKLNKSLQELELNQTPRIGGGDFTGFCPTDNWGTYWPTCVVAK